MSVSALSDVSTIMKLAFSEHAPVVDRCVTVDKSVDSAVSIEFIIIALTTKRIKNKLMKVTTFGWQDIRVRERFKK